MLTIITSQKYWLAHVNNTCCLITPLDKNVSMCQEYINTILTCYNTVLVCRQHTDESHSLIVIGFNAVGNKELNWSSLGVLYNLCFQVTIHNLTIKESEVFSPYPLVPSPLVDKSSMDPIFTKSMVAISPCATYNRACAQTIIFAARKITCGKKEFEQERKTFECYTWYEE